MRYSPHKGMSRLTCKFGAMNSSFRSQPFAALTTLVTIFLCACSPQNQGGHDHGLASQPMPVPASIPPYENVDPAVKAQIAGFLIGYFKLNDALIEDSLAGATVAAVALSEISKKFEVSKLTSEQMDFYLVQSSKLKRGLQDISDSEDLEKARLGLAIVSEAMYSLVKAFQPHESTLYYQYCPMARNNQGANWLSSTEELVNPYMGQMMLQCGRTQEKLEVTMNSKK